MPAVALLNERGQITAMVNMGMRKYASTDIIEVKRELGIDGIKLIAMAVK
jgi:hypothetical protein